METATNSPTENASLRHRQRPEHLNLCPHNKCVVSRRVAVEGMVLDAGMEVLIPRPLASKLAAEKIVEAGEEVMLDDLGRVVESAE